jgi:hypothetical protein
LRSIEKELLGALCLRINQEAVAIVRSEAGSEHEKYLKLYKHIRDSDRIVADCFNDWSRSNVILKTFCLRQHGLLADEQLEKLSDETRDRIRTFESMQSDSS